MNSTLTAPPPYTPLEGLLLFRGIARYGLDPSAFARIAEALQSNALIKSSATYDARRLSPEPLQELFLRLLSQELRPDAADQSDLDRKSVV